MKKLDDWRDIDGVNPKFLLRVIKMKKTALAGIFYSKFRINKRRNQYRFTAQKQTFEKVMIKKAKIHDK